MCYSINRGDNMKKNAWLKYETKDIKKLNEVCDGYKDFLSNNKTERECVNTIVDLVESKGFKNLTLTISASISLSFNFCAILYAFDTIFPIAIIEPSLIFIGIITLSPLLALIAPLRTILSSKFI